MHMALWSQLGHLTNHVRNQLVKRAFPFLQPELVYRFERRDCERHAIVKLRRNGLLQHGKHHPTIDTDNNSAHPILRCAVRFRFDDYLTRELSTANPHQAARHQLVRFIPLAQPIDISMFAHNPAGYFLLGFAIHQSKTDTWRLIRGWEHGTDTYRNGQSPCT